MPYSVFLAWLRSGVCWLPLIKFAPADDDICVQLPSKYSRMLQSGSPVAALIDEVLVVAQSTPAMTEELDIRLRNLGEAWLPVHYFAFEELLAGIAAPDGVASTETSRGATVDVGCATTSEAQPSATWASEPSTPGEEKYVVTASINPTAAKAINEDLSPAEEDTAQALPLEQSRLKKKTQARRKSVAKNAKSGLQVENCTNQPALMNTSDDKAQADEA